MRLGNPTQILALYFMMTTAARADQIRLPPVTESCRLGTLDIDLSRPPRRQDEEDLFSASRRPPQCASAQVRIGDTESEVLVGARRSFPICLGEGGVTTIIWQGSPVLVQLQPGGILRYYLGPYCELLPDIPAIDPSTAAPKFTRCIGKRARCPHGFTRPPPIRGDGNLCVGERKKVPCVADGQLRFRSSGSATLELDAPNGNIQEVRLAPGVPTPYFPLFFMDSYDGIWKFRIDGRKYLVLIGFGQRWTVDVGGDGGTPSVKVEDW